MNISNALQRFSVPGPSEDARRIDEALARLANPPEEPKLPATETGHLLFGLDLTASRERTLRDARVSIAAMFRALAQINAGVVLKLAYFRGRDECRVSAWEKDPAILSRAMEKLSCKTGETQIHKILRLALDEKDQISALVYVGDVCEETASELIVLAAALGEKRTPIFVFHDLAGADRGAAKRAEPVFRQLAETSGGAYCTFGEGSAAALREMLSTVAAFTSAGVEGIEQMPAAMTAEAKQLHKRLLLLGPDTTPK